MILSVWDKILNKQFSPIYLVYGTEQFLINETKQLLMENILQEEDLEFNFSVYDLEEVSIDEALEDAETIPFLGDKRLVFLENPVFLTAGKKKVKVEHTLTKLENYIINPPQYTTLVFLAPYEKLDDRRKITKQLKRDATVVEAKKLTDRKLTEWIIRQFNNHSVEISDDALQLLRLLVEDDLFSLVNEADKLALYVGENGFINKEIVEKLVPRSLEHNIFTLVDNVVHRNIDKAFRIYYDLIKQNEEPIKILAVITGQFRLISQVKDLARRGYGERQIAGYLKVHPYRVKLALTQARYFSDGELKEIINLLTESDYALKTGLMEKELVVEMFLFKLYNRSHRTAN